VSETVCDPAVRARRDGDRTCGAHGGCERRTASARRPRPRRSHTPRRPTVAGVPTHRGEGRRRRAADKDEIE